jgi:hypothetical protein
MFSHSDGLNCDAEKVFDKRLERNLDDVVFFKWCSRWCFDPGKKPFLLEETFSNLLSKKIEHLA